VTKAGCRMMNWGGGYCTFVFMHGMCSFFILVPLFEIICIFGPLLLVSSDLTVPDDFFAIS
jgi:hypothetical protein